MSEAHHDEGNIHEACEDYLPNLSKQPAVANLWLSPCISV